ncbi:MAG: S41 family peptidase [Vicinamibacteria bacterium]
MSARARLFVAIVSTGIVGYIALGSVLGRVLGDTSYSQLTVFNEVVRLVLDSYVDPVNVDRAMAGAELGLTEALDGDSAYLDAEELKAYQQPVKESDADIGVVLSRRYGFLAVVAPRSGSPAAKAGVKAGDIIKTIDGRHSRTVSVPDGERLLRGAPGSTVKLRLLRQGADPIDVAVVRERVTPEPVRGKRLDAGPGYVKVTEFTAHTAEELATEVESLKKGGAKSLVLDLRGAAYGTPENGVKAAELFLKGGVVTKLVGRRIEERVLSADPARGVWDLPLAVLVDNGTAGPGEIVAAALLDGGHTPVIGERTFGRAPVQRIVPLQEGALLLTVAKYVSPKGNSIHGKGVEPTVPVASPEDEDETAGQPTKDTILDKAIEVLTAEAKKAA